MSEPVDQRFVLHGRPIVYNHTTKFRVETAKGTGLYKPTYVGLKSPAAAVMFFDRLSLSKGIKKRLVMIHDGREKTIAREAA